MGKSELVALLSLYPRDCCVALPRGVMGLSASRDCVIFRAYSLIFNSIQCTSKG